MSFQHIGEILKRRYPVGTNFIKEIRKEQAEARKQNPSYRVVKVRSLSTESRYTPYNDK